MSGCVERRLPSHHRIDSAVLFTKYRGLAYGLLAILAILLVASAVLTYRQLEASKGLYTSVYRTGAWVASRAEVQGIRLQNDLDRFVFGDLSTSHDMLKESLEIYRNRILMLDQGDEAELIRSAKAVDANVESLVAGLAKIEGMLFTLKRRDMAGHQAIRTLLDDQTSHLRDMNQELFAHQLPVSLRARLFDTDWADQTYVSGLTVIGIILLLLLFSSCARLANTPPSQFRSTPHPRPRGTSLPTRLKAYRTASRFMTHRTSSLCSTAITEI
ncbi:MAG: hypothetical protein O2795_20300 [Acidobacteria bacterium]|nr:hypothetical protein [Acidobacteriota bacterium]